MFDYGKYTDLIFLSYGIVFLVLGALTIGILYYGRRTRQKLAELEDKNNPK